MSHAPPSDLQQRDEPRVLVVSPRYVPDFYGPAAQVHQIAVALRAQGVDVRVLTAGQRPPRSVVDGVPVEAVAGGPFPVVPGRGSTLVAEAWRQAWRLRALRQHADLVYILDYKYQATILALVARALGLRVVVRRSIDAPPGRVSRLRRARDAVRDRCTDAAIAVSAATYVASGGPASRHPEVFHVPNGVDVARFRPAHDTAERTAARRALGAPADAFVCLCAGAIHPRKGTLDVVTGWARALADEPGALLWLVGPCRDSAYQALVETAAGRLGVGDRVRFFGEQPDMPVYYRAADVFLFGSVREGLPNAVLEALACGLPVVARDIPGVRELVSSERGYLYGTGIDDGVEGLAAALRTIRRDPGSARERAQRGRAFVMERHTLDAAAAGHHAVFRWVMHAQSIQPPVA